MSRRVFLSGPRRSATNPLAMLRVELSRFKVKFGERAMVTYPINLPTPSSSVYFGQTLLKMRKKRSLHNPGKIERIVARENASSTV